MVAYILKDFKIYCLILNNQGIVVSQSKVARIMKLFNLYSVIRIKKCIENQKKSKK